MEVTKYGVSSNIKRDKLPQEETNNKKLKIEPQPLASVSNKKENTTDSLEIIQKQRRALPVYKSRNRIINVIKEHPSVILIGETASGKTTQVPQFLLETNIARGKMIAITQPRRVAAITVAQRVAAERNCTLGEVVGYAVRFEEACTHKTKLKFLTDGLLLREALSDSLLLAYNVIILDEAHERTLATDILFGVVKAAQQKRSQHQQAAPLKVVVMSATMDVDPMRAYFSPRASKGVPGRPSQVPVLWVEGRTHQVELRQTVKSQQDYLMACLTTLFMVHRDTPASEGVLIFLTGQEEIEAMAANIPSIAREVGGANVRVLPLYSALPQEQQALAFRPAPPGCRKIVLATNVAETSVTIAGIRHVIDSGMVKARTHFPDTGLDVLKVQRISQAQAWQRTGRAGREAPGVCYRCYTKQEFNSMSKASEPEIRRVNLTTVVLQLLAMGISKVAEFDFMDKPKEAGLDDAVSQLKTLGAVTNVTSLSLTKLKPDLKLTELGHQMSRFPLDARFSKVLIASSQMGCMEEILSLVALLSGEGVVLSSSSHRAEAQAAQLKFHSENGDHESLLNIYRAYCSAKQKKAFCHENQLSLRALQQASQVRSQLVELCKRAGLEFKSCGSDLTTMRRCLLTGLFSNLATHMRDKIYVTVTRQHVVSLHPSSVLFSSAPAAPCVLYTELVQTGRSYMRQVSLVEAQWLAEINPEFARKHRLDSSSASAAATASS